MPRDGSGVYSKATPSVEPNTTIASSVFNAIVDDFVNDANTARPVSAGGTGASSAAAARTNLDVAQKQTGTTDATVGAGLVVGAFGLGANAPTQATPDTSGLFTGFMREGQAAGDDLRLRISASVAEMADLVAVPSTEALSFRGMTGGVWGSLRRIFHQGSILGTVSQSGGTPTGALIQTGSGANGKYVRLANGLQVCWLPILPLTFAATDHCAGTWTFPAAFASADKVFVGGLLSGGSTVADNSTNLGSGDVARAEVGALAVGPRTTTTATLRVFRQSGAGDFQSGDALYAAVFAIGKWF